MPARLLFFSGFFSLGLISLMLQTSCKTTQASTESALPPLPLKGVWHQVMAGQNTEQLAKYYGVQKRDIEEINGLNQTNPLKTGQLIFIPDGDKSNSPSTSTQVKDTIKDTKNISDDKNQKFLIPKTFLFPITKGKIVSRFGPRNSRPHEGIDIAAPEGTAILATSDGLVIFSGLKVRGYGNLVIVKHADGFVSIYAHNKKNLVTEKDSVTRGQVIAEVGKTGNATTSHLHFEIRRGEVPLNPELFLITH